jgi:hypothetical protein
MSEEDTPVKVPDEDSIDEVALLPDEIIELRGQVDDLRSRLSRLERQAGRGVPHPSEVHSGSEGWPPRYPGGRSGLSLGG